MASIIAPNLSQLRPALVRLPRLPDLLTTANLCCGVGSILLASQGQLTIACGLIFLAAVFDVFDGLAARALGGGTPLGAQLDSLADMVSFGVAPAMILYRSPILLAYPASVVVVPIDFSAPHPMGHLGLIAPIIIAVSSLWRLAKFNLDTRQSHGFLGLATPANTLFWIGSTLTIANTGVLSGPGADSMQSLLRIVYENPGVMISVSLLLGILMLSEIPLPSLKFKHKGWKGNEVVFLLIGMGAVLALLYGILAVPLILIIYLLSPLWGKLFPKNASPQRHGDTEQK